MPRRTITLSASLEARARRLARQRGLPLGQFLRETLEAALDEPAVDTPPDPFFADHAVSDRPTPPDLAQNHDRYLYGEDE